MTHTRLEELAQRLAARTQELRGGRSPAPALRVVAGEAHAAPGERRMDAIMREWHCRMIRNVRRRWGEPIQHVIDQACCGVVDIDQLADDALIQLHKDMERAEECIREGISFHDAGLLRAHYG